ncbi:hypothetical protein [Rhodoflexus caldus]|uniref:hypothetical protein n=1 Tax=Rhodoflexus caldus TaxID=2891236 RepID=UPI002029E473|nr:hypothetical protein [Rhodoflexus caldus]
MKKSKSTTPKQAAKPTPTVYELTLALEGLKEIQAAKMPATKAYEVFKAVRTLQPVAEAAAEAERGLFQKFGKEQDGKLVIAPENVQAFIAEKTALFNRHEPIALPAFDCDFFNDLEVSPAFFAKIAVLIG